MSAPNEQTGNQQTDQTGQTDQHSTGNEQSRGTTDNGSRTVNVHTDSSGITNALSGMNESVQALPERVANAVREAVPQPSVPSGNETDSEQTGQQTQQTGQQTQQTGQQTQQTGQQTPPRKRSFAEKWFGVNQ